MTVDAGKPGVDSDHCGVEALPRNNLAPMGSRFREEIRVQPFPESALAEFGCLLQGEDWGMLHESMTASEMVESFEAHSNNLVTAHFPAKTVLEGASRSALVYRGI